MSGTNHITGGIIFTGLFTSFWNINIFAKPEYMGLCAFTSLLPDIDHTKSPIGKLFYPLANYLDRKFGHRTITHSLLFFVVLLLLISTLEKIYSKDLHLSLIAAFSYASHLIFDMMTKEGVPLLYPFNKTPCVIPANPDRRLRSGDFKTECVIFCLFIAIGLSCKPLFENGFWTTLDRALGTIKHVHYEFIESKQLIQLKYKATYMGKKYKGQGYIAYTDPHKIRIFDKQGYTELNDTFQISQLEPTKTNIPYQTEELYFHDLSPDQLQNLIHNKPILELHIQANNPISYTENNQIHTSTQVNMDYTYNPPLIWVQEEDQVLNTKKKVLAQKLSILQKEAEEILKKEHQIQSRISKLTNTIPQMSAYNRQKATQELQALKRQLEKLDKQPYTDKIDQVQFNLAQLQSKPAPLCSGYMQYLVLPM